MSASQVCYLCTWQCCVEGTCLSNCLSGDNRFVPDAGASPTCARHMMQDPRWEQRGCALAAALASAGSSTQRPAGTVAATSARGERRRPLV